MKRVYKTQHDREELLISLTEKTGGSVMSCSTVQQVLQAKVGKRNKKCTLSKMQLCLAPKLTIAVRAAKLLERAKTTFTRLA